MSHTPDLTIARIYAYIYNSGKKHTMRTPSTFNGGVVDID